MQFYSLQTTAIIAAPDAQVERTTMAKGPPHLSSVGPVRHGARQLRRLLRAGQAPVYVRVLPGLPVALGDPFFRLALARAAATAGLDLFPPPRPAG